MLPLPSAERFQLNYFSKKQKIRESPSTRKLEKRYHNMLMYFKRVAILYIYIAEDFRIFLLNTWEKPAKQ